MEPELVERIAVGELRLKLERGEPLVVGDVRAPAVFARGHIPGSVCLFLREVEAWAPTIPQDREVVLY